MIPTARPVSGEELELQRWLATATNGLPRPIRRSVEAELTDHYQSARDDFRQEGLGDHGAHLAALEALGDARLTASAMRRVYPMRHHYWLAIAASQVFAMLLIGRAILLPFLAARGWIGYFSFAVMVSQPPCLLLIFHTLQRHSRHRYRLDRSIRLLSCGLILWLPVLLINGALDRIELPFWLNAMIVMTYAAVFVIITVGFIGVSASLGKMEWGSRWLRYAARGLLVLDSLHIVALLVLACLEVRADTYGASALIWLKNGLELVGTTGLAAYALTAASLAGMLAEALCLPVRQAPT